MRRELNDRRAALQREAALRELPATLDGLRAVAAAVDRFADDARDLVAAGRPPGRTRQGTARPRLAVMRRQPNGRGRRPPTGPSAPASARRGPPSWPPCAPASAPTPRPSSTSSTPCRPPSPRGSRPPRRSATRCRPRPPAKGAAEGEVRRRGRGGGDCHSVRPPSSDDAPHGATPPRPRSAPRQSRTARPRQRSSSLPEWMTQVTRWTRHRPMPGVRLRPALLTTTRRSSTPSTCWSGACRPPTNGARPRRPGSPTGSRP